MRSIVPILVIVAVTALAASPVSAQCEHWQPGPPVPGTDWWVYDSLVWDNGSGPALYLGGAISKAGNIRAGGIVKWDGRAWSAVGNPNFFDCKTLGVYKGQLIAAGSSSPYMIRFDGASWIPIPGAPIGVADMIEYDGKLVVAGGNIKQWDGQTWNSMKGGVELIDPEFSAGATSLAIHEGKLIVGGEFKKAGGVEAWSLASWDGTDWHAMAPEQISSIRALRSHQGQLVVAGTFDAIGGTKARNIAAWNGVEWTSLRDGLDEPDALVVLNGKLCAKQKRGAPGGPYTGVYRWTGSEWELFVNELTGYFNTINVFGGRLVLGGLFFCDGPPTARNIATWNGEHWRGLQDGILGPDGPILTFGEFQGELLVGGEFASVDGRPINALAATDGRSWRELGDGIEAHSPIPGTVTAFGEFGERLIVSGWFKKVGGASVEKMAQWDGGIWEPFLFKPMAPARGMVPWKSDLIIGGEFVGQNQIDEMNWDGAKYIVKGPNAKYCEPIGGGMDRAVFAVTTYQGEVIAGGQFFYAGGDHINGIARWDGFKWRQLGNGLYLATINAMTKLGTDLYAAGYISDVNGRPGGSIARWDGTEWHTLGTGVDGYINAVTLHKGELYVAGEFKNAGGVPARNIARWDGTQWHALDDGLDAVVYSLGSYNNRLYAGGRFAGSGSVSSPFLAVWGCAPCPADCDHSGSLDIDDFICFQTLFGLGDLGADCDASGEPDIDDFICFQTSFAQGCP